MWGLKLNSYTFKYLYFLRRQIKETKKMEKLKKMMTILLSLLLVLGTCAEYDCMQVLARHELVTGQPTDNDGNCSAAPCPAWP